MPNGIETPEERVAREAVEFEQRETALREVGGPTIGPTPTTPIEIRAGGRLSFTEELAIRANEMGFETAPDPMAAAIQELGLPPRHEWQALGQVGVFEELPKKIKNLIPVIGGIDELFTGIEEKNAFQNLELFQKGTPIPDYTEADRQADIGVIQKKIAAAQYSAARGSTIGASIVAGVKDLFPFAFEFVVSGGVATAARTATRGAITRGLSKIGLEKGVELVGGLGGRIAGAAARTGLSGHRVLQAYVDRRAPSRFNLTPRGELLVEVPGQGIATSLLKATGDTMIEMFAEEAGDVIGRTAGRIFNKIPGSRKFTERVGIAIQRASSLPKAEFVSRIATRAGYHGILEEMGEERLGDVLRSITGVQGLDLQTALFPGWRQLVIEAGIFAVPAGAKKVATAYEKIKQTKEDNNQLKTALLTDTGASAWAQIYPSEAKTITEKKEPTRKDVEEVTGVKMNMSSKERAEFSKLLKRPVEDIDKKGLLDELALTADKAEAVGRGEVIAPAEEITPEEIPAEEETALQRIQREAAEREEVTLFGAGIQDPLQPRRPIRPGVIPPPIQAPPEVERRLQQAHGIKPTSKLDKIKGVVGVIPQKLRAQEFIPNTPEFASANEGLRLLKNNDFASRDAATRTVAAIIDPMGPKQLPLYERKVIANNEEAKQKKNLGLPPENHHLRQPLRYGFKNLEEIQQYQAQLEPLVAQAPEVAQALENRRGIVTELVDRLVETKLLGEDARENAETYVHQMVESRVQGTRLSKGFGPKITKKAFQKKRVTDIDELGEEFDPNTSYVEHETAWITDALVQLGRVEFLQGIEKQYDKMGDLREEAERQRDEGKEVTWDDLLKELPDHEVWSPIPGNLFHRAYAIPERIQEQVQKAALEGLAGPKLTPDQIRTVMVMSTDQQQMILPVEIVRQLNSMEKPKEVGPLDELARDAMRMWKVWILLSPTRAGGYMLRNITGDLDPVIGGAPGVLNFTKKAVNDLFNFHRGGLKLSKAMEASRDLGVVSSSLTAQEIPEIKDIKVFNAFYENETSMKSPIKAWFDTVRGLNEFRENVLRHGAFLYYQNKLSTNTLKNYGGSKKAVVDALRKEMGLDVAAAHLARNLLGDYGNLSVMGEWLRAHLIPFWSWQEINFKRLPRMFINSVEFGKLKGAGSVFAAGVYAGITMMRLGTLYGMMYAWNNMVWPDEERDLGRFDRSNPHIIFGRNTDGSIRVLRNTGAMGDVTEWLGLNALLELWPLFEADQITGTDIAKAVGEGFVNKAISGIRPDIKGVGELLISQSLFPDVLNPRMAQRGEIAAGQLGLRDIYREIKGRIFKTGARGRPNLFTRLLFGIVNPQDTALGEMYDLRNRFRVKKGKRPQNFKGISPVRDMKQAGINMDFKAFKEGRIAYLATNNNFKNFKNSLRNFDPISARLNDADEKEFEQEFLTAEQRVKLQVARDFAQNLRVRLWHWWVKAAEEQDTPELKKALKEQIDLDVTSKARTISSERPKDRSKRAAWKIRVEKAFKSLNEMGIRSTDKILRVFVKQSHKRKGRFFIKTPKTRVERNRRLRRALAKLRKQFKAIPENERDIFEK